MNDWSETYRGTVPPWECDITEHFTIAYYLDRLTDSERNLADLLELGDLLRGGGFHRRFTCGSCANCAPAAVSISRARRCRVDGGLRLGHRFVDSANGAIVTWVEERWDLSGVPLPQARRDAIASRLAAWEGPAIEERPEPASRDGFMPTARGRVKPGDLDADGRLSSRAIVHRFTDATDPGRRRDRHGCRIPRRPSPRHVDLRAGAAALRRAVAGRAVSCRTGIAHFGNSSLRLVHIMTDPRNGREVARMSQYAVNLDLDARRPAKWPDEIRARALPLVVPVG